jgi:hypothetical protein
MSALFGPNNAIAYAQFELKGGWKNLLFTTLAYALVIIGAIGLTLRLSERPAEVYGGWRIGLLALQGALLLILGSNRLNAAIQSDFKSGIIESHRMMPMSNLSAILGYIAGATSQAVAMAFATFLIGIPIVLLGQLDPRAWFVSGAILFTFAVFAWTYMTLNAFLGRGAGNLGLVWMGVFGMGSPSGLLSVVPALMMLLSPLAGYSVFDSRARSSEFTPALAMSLLSQAIVGGIFVAGAMRKFRRPEGLALGRDLSTMLLAGWVLLGVVAMYQWHQYAPLFARSESGPQTQFLAMLFTGMAIALVPLCAFARADSVWRRHAATDHRGRRAPLSPVLGTLIVVAILGLLLLAAPDALAKRYPRGELATAAESGAGLFDFYRENLLYVRHTGPEVARQLGLTALVLVSFALGVCFVARWVYLAVSNAKLIVGVWLAITLVAPLLVDIALAATSNDPDPPVPGAVANFGPIGALVNLWTWGKVNPAVGIYVQTAYWLLPAAVYLRAAAKVSAGQAARAPEWTPQGVHVGEGRQGEAV